MTLGVNIDRFYDFGKNCIASLTTLVVWASVGATLA